MRVESINAKLQALARELQKDNKLVHERSQAAFAVEEQKRKTLQDSFQKTAGDISARCAIPRHAFLSQCPARVSHVILGLQSVQWDLEHGWHGIYSIPTG